MIFADKLIQLRKKAGWSQKELAKQLNVSRQSVSKWEGAESVPDPDKIMRLSELFGVSADFLRNDETEETEPMDSAQSIQSLRRVSLEDANAFLSVTLRTAKTLACAAFLGCSSLVPLFILLTISKSTAGALDEEIADGIGRIVLLLLVAIAAVMFISSCVQAAPFAYLKKKPFEPESGVNEMVKERQAQYKKGYRKNMIAGSCFGIAAIISLFVASIIDANNGSLLTILLSLVFLLASIAVACLVKTVIIWAGFETLLQKGEYAKANKKAPFYSKVLLDSIEKEKKGLDYTYPKADKKVLRKLLKEINRYAGTNFHYLAELDAFDIHGTGNIVAKYITEFSSEDVRGYLVPQMVADKIKDCDRLVLQLYMHFRASDEYIAKPGEPAPAHIYVRYDNAFRRLKPKRLAKDLIALAHNPRDAFYLPLTMRMLASWKIPEMKDILLSYSANDSFSDQDVGIYDSENPYFPPYEGMKRELTFTAIDGLKYYPSAEVREIITSFANSTDKDIKAAAEQTLTALNKRQTAGITPSP